MAEEPEEDDEEQPKKAKKAKPPGKPRDWPLIALVGGTALFVLFFAAITLMAPRRPMLFIRAVGEAISRKAPEVPKVSLTPAAATPAVGTPAGAPAAGTPAPKPADSKPAEAKPPAKP